MRKLTFRGNNARFWLRFDLGSISIGFFNISKYLKLPSFDFFIEGSLREFVDAAAERLGEKDKAAFRAIVFMLLACFSIVIFQKIIESII